MRYVITGGSGYIGSRLMDLLSRRNDTERIVICDIAPPRDHKPRVVCEADDQVEVTDAAAPAQVVVGAALAERDDAHPLAPADEIGVALKNASRMVLEPSEVSVCPQPPGFEVDLEVRVDTATLYRIYLGRAELGGACGYAS